MKLNHPNIKEIIIPMRPPLDIGFLGEINAGHPWDYRYPKRVFVWQGITVTDDDGILMNMYEEDVASTAEEISGYREVVLRRKGRRDQ